MSAVAFPAEKAEARAGARASDREEARKDYRVATRAPSGCTTTAGARPRKNA